MIYYFEVLKKRNYSVSASSPLSAQPKANSVLISAPIALIIRFLEGIATFRPVAPAFQRGSAERKASLQCLPPDGAAAWRGGRSRLATIVFFVGGGVWGAGGFFS